MAPAIGSGTTELTSNRRLTARRSHRTGCDHVRRARTGGAGVRDWTVNGSKVPGAAIPIGSYAAGTPFSSGQVLEIKIPPNSNLTPGAGVKIVECAAPGGVVPSNPAACDGSTIQGNTVYVQPNGSVDYKRTKTNTGYTVYAIPDFHSLGNPRTRGRSAT